MSTTANTINLFGQAYPFRLGIKFQRVFMHHYKLKKLDSFQSKMALLEKMDTLEGIEVLGVFVLCAIQAASKKRITIDPDDIVDYVTINGVEVIQPMLEALNHAQPNKDVTLSAVEGQDNTQDAVGKSNK